MSDSLQQYVVPPPSPVTNPDLKRQTETGSLTSFKVGQWLIDGAVIKAGDSISLNAGDKTISVGTILLDGSNSTIRTSDTGENVKITSSYISLRNALVETGYLRGYQTTDRYGVALNASELSVTDVKATRLSNAGLLMLNSSGGGGTLDASWIFATTDSSNADRPLALISSVLYITGDQTGSPGILDLGTTDTDLRIRITSAAPTGGASGSIALDTTNSRLYAKVGGTWKSVLLS